MNREMLKERRDLIQKIAELEAALGRITFVTSGCEFNGFEKVNQDAEKTQSEVNEQLSAARIRLQEVNHILSIPELVTSLVAELTELKKQEANCQSIFGNPFTRIIIAKEAKLKALLEEAKNV